MLRSRCSFVRDVGAGGSVGAGGAVGLDGARQARAEHRAVFAGHAARGQPDVAAARAARCRGRAAARSRGRARRSGIRRPPRSPARPRRADRHPVPGVHDGQVAGRPRHPAPRPPPTRGATCPADGRARRRCRRGCRARSSRPPAATARPARASRRRRQQHAALGRLDRLRPEERLQIGLGQPVGVLARGT